MAKDTPSNAAAAVLPKADPDAIPPLPPGGGRWRWTGSGWEDLNPKPAESAATTTSASE